MKKLLKILFSFIILISILLSIIYFENNNRLRIYFFNIGQGDSIFIRTPSNENILIDGGPDNTLITKLGSTLPFYDQTIDLIILTHPHDDHLFGLINVLERYNVKKILYYPTNHETNAYTNFKEIISEKNIPTVEALAGQIFNFKDVKIKVIYPFPDLEMSNLNNYSVVTRLSYQEIDFFFTGDLEKEGEEIVLENYEYLESEVLKAGHHGSKTSSTLEFVKFLNPDIVAIQVGVDNKFNHPSESVIARFNNLDIEIYRNDLMGDICFEVFDNILSLCE